MELADEIASYVMDQLHPDGWMENENPKDERSPLRPKPEHEDEWADMYSDVDDLITDCELRNVLNIDWESLQVQKEILITWRKHMSNTNLYRKHLSGMIHLLDNLQDHFQPKPEE